jgi:acetyl-CoA carboxylase biotin carboxylase subunit
MGMKDQARATMAEAGLPVVPGSRGAVASLEEARVVAESVGLPLLVKAAGGGGGRGIRIVETMDQLEDAWERAGREAASAFGNKDLYLERYLKDPRHIEIQVIADNFGHVATLGERESSLQRRRQKILEEAPSPAVTPELRERMSDAAREAARAVGYRSAGTMEFLLDDEGRFYFMEMNTRVQVEHAVTEMVTGFDIVKEQIRIAAGEPLAIEGDHLDLTGWSLECRINAEDPDQQFRPSPGQITRYEVPQGPWVRVDSGAEAGTEVQPSYDSLLAKVVTWGRDREEAVDRMARALSEFQIEGVKTTLDLHRSLLNDPDFRSGRIHTNFLAKRIPGA